MVGVPAWFPAIRVGVVAAVLGSLSLVWWLDRTRDWGARRRSRLLLGVPWGTLLSVAIVLFVYLLLQDGLGHPNNPVTVPFRSWSYFYPLGMVVAPFAHNGPNHLLGNLVGTVVLGTLAEYAWSHFPRERGTTTFSSLGTNPYVRAFVAFPAGVLVVGVLTSVLSWGPIIGFSGVVFAYAGFALVRYPLGTVVALEAQGVVRVVLRALREPVTVAKAEPSFGRPWWAGIAVQGHLLGLFMGIIAGALVLRRWEGAPTTRRFAGMLIVATSFSLWAVWWFRDNVRFVLHRGIGVVLVFSLAILVTLGLRAVASDGRTLLAVPWRQIGVLLLVFPILVVGFAAVPLNLSTVADEGPPNPDAAVTVRDYTVTYAENVTHGQTSVVNLSAFGETTTVRTSGVIVVSEERHIWTRAVSTSRLAFTGETVAGVGGLGWREFVGVRRRGWNLVGNGSAYAVWLKPPGEDWRPAHLSEPKTAEPVLAGTRVSIRPTAAGFALELSRNDTGEVIGREPVPSVNATATVGDVRFERERRGLYAAVDGTRVRVARNETYE